jgi:MoaA/NifB/PqqE/SkfB family radical SAM enzyme
MNLSGLHLLLTYQCNFECDHCFVWGSPQQNGTLSLKQVRHILDQAQELGTVEWIYFEGGEPFLYYPILLQGVQAAAGMGFRVGIVSNAYWATEEEDALEWLKPLAGLIQDLSVSSDLYHWDEKLSRQARHARAAAERLAIPLDIITIAEMESEEAAGVVGQLPAGETGVMFRGRAAEKLAVQAPRQPWETFSACPHEDLREPGRVHVDALGNVHVCHGISIGNLFRQSLSQICRSYTPEAHPVAGPLLAGGPAELIRRYNLPTSKGYADACHACDEARRALRPRFPDTLMPDQIYGVF